MMNPTSYGMTFDLDDSMDSAEEESDPGGDKDDSSPAFTCIPQKESSMCKLKERFDLLKKRRQELARRAELSKARKEERALLKRRREEAAEEAKKKKVAESSETDPNGPSEEAVEKRWEEIRSYIDVNRHLDGVDRGRYAAKGGLEEKIDSAVELGDFESAEKLSDQLANREFGRKIADAFDAKAWAEQTKVNEEWKKERKKEKLKWGFDHKQRWETKGNM